ncbi:MAG: M20/M25/M40 family metallo-hydrolase, partial [Thermoanaerobaculia bacterium]|nr:M20/M25/M40 family metallo-hydrolase [Thermoanaerobaculia bacterium]
GDDKVPVPAWIHALDALDRSGIERTSNLLFFFEGEEEMGSPHLGTYLDEYRAKLEGVDAWLIFDGPVHQSRRPQLVFGVRGITSVDITVYGASKGLHSGHYGNWAPNPGMMLAQLLASMKDDDGNVTIEGFYDSTVPVGPAEQEALESVPDPDESLRAELGLARTEGGNAPLKERLLLPSLNVRGLESANVGEEARNVIPSTATAAIDIRLVKGNEPERMLDLVETHIREQGYHVVREEPDMETRLKHERIAKVERHGGYVAARTNMSHPFVQDLAEAAERAAGEPVILVPSLGGSLPLYLFTERFEAPLVIVPIANHDNNQHAPNENIRLANLWYGIDLVAAILTME